MFDILSINPTADLIESRPVLGALAPALVIMAYFGVGLLIYIVRYLVKGSYHDQEVENRKVSALIGTWLLRFFSWVVRPFFLAVRFLNIPANAVTLVSMLFAVAAAVCFGMGYFALGGWLYLFAGICDNFDGRLARERGEAGPRGAALDSIIDRYSEGAVLMGFAWYYRDSWVLLAVLVAMVGTFVIPYVRAKGEVLRINMEVGLMQRAERVLYLGLTAALSPVLEAILLPNTYSPLHIPVVIVLVFLALSTQVTAVSRFVYLLGQLKKQEAREEPNEQPVETHPRFASQRVNARR
jgi:phosphatidylglycerophosphate synthase